MDIVIAGAGIGGLAAALSLAAAGFHRVRIVEAAPEIRPFGVGLNILPNAVRELAELDIFNAAAMKAIQTAELAFFHRSGSLIWSEQRGIAAGHRWPQLSLSRSHLVNVLAKAVTARLGADTIQTDARVTDFTQLPNGRVQILLEHRHITQMTSIEADLLIGADGLHSTVRATLYPGEGEPCTNGLTMWRGTTWAKPYLTGRTMIIIGDDRKKFVAYPIVPPTEPNGLTLINWVTGRPADNIVSQDLDTRRAQVLHHFGNWPVSWLNIPALVKEATSILEYPMLDRDPLPRWAFGPVVLLGDAAHPMFPVGSNGATQAIIDGRFLAHALATCDDINEALAVYERERRPAMTKIQKSNRQMGPERVIDLVHQRAPNGFDRIDDVISKEELEHISSEYAETGGFAPTMLPTQPSYAVPYTTAPGEQQKIPEAIPTETSNDTFVDIRPFMTTFPTGVGIITAIGTDGNPWGMTCTSICSVTLEPPTLLVCLRQGSPTLEAILTSGTFALNLLHDDAHLVAELFASGDPNRFAQIGWNRPAASKGPHLIHDAHMIADCKVIHAEIVGNHTVVFGEVLLITQQSEKCPLLYGFRHYKRWPGDDNTYE